MEKRSHISPKKVSEFKISSFAGKLWKNWQNCLNFRRQLTFEMTYAIWSADGIDFKVWSSNWLWIKVNLIIFIQFVDKPGLGDLREDLIIFSHHRSRPQETGFGTSWTTLVQTWLLRPSKNWTIVFSEIFCRGPLKIEVRGILESNFRTRKFLEGIHSQCTLSFKRV